MKTPSKKIIIEGKINPYNLGAFQMFYEHMVIKNLSQGTIEGYKSDLFQFFNYLYKYKDDKKFNTVIQNDIEDYIKFCMINGNNEDRLRRRCASLNSMYNLLRKKNIVENNPMQDIDRPKKKLDVREKHFLTEQQVKVIKKNLYKLNNIVAESYVLLSLSTAGRISAINNIKWQDINFEEREIKVIEKGSNQTTIYFSEEVKEKLIELKNFYEINNINLPYVFITKYRGEYRHACKASMRKWTRQTGELIGISNFAPHSYRRTTATILKNNGMPLEDVSYILNHSSTQTTQRYIKQNKHQIKNLKDSLHI